MAVSLLNRQVKIHEELSDGVLAQHSRMTLVCTCHVILFACMILCIPSLIVCIPSLIVLIFFGFDSMPFLAPCLYAHPVDKIRGTDALVR